MTMYSQTNRIVILVPKNDPIQIQKEYLDFLSEGADVITLFIDPTRKKTKAADMKEYLASISDELSKYEIVLIADAEYFKVFTKLGNAPKYLGYMVMVGNQQVAYLPNYKAIFYDPIKVRQNIKIALDMVNKSIQGIYIDPGSNIIHHAEYPSTLETIQKSLKRCLECSRLTCDIETYSLKVTEAQIASITFCWNKHEGIAFQVDKSPNVKNLFVRGLLYDFFTNYKGNLIFHNIAFDATVLIYNLFMADITDSQGLLLGLKCLLRDFDDTKLIGYLATNSCSGNDLSLKSLSQEYAGNYAQEDINDVTKIPLDQLLQYNLTDGLATWYVYNKYYPKMVEDQQKEIYETLFKPATKDIIQMQLTGFPLDMKRVEEVKQMLLNDQNNALDRILNSPLVISFMEILRDQWVTRTNNKLKKKKVTGKDFKEQFNPRSPIQLKELLYDYLELPILNKTATNQPSTDGDTLTALLNHTKDENVINLIQGFIDYSAVNKILTAFIPAFEQAPKGSDGWNYLIGNFNLGGTVSGRLSSSSPNLQNLPATGSKYAKLIKSCFKAPEGWLLCGLDFAALEDHISALTTKDINKLRVYTGGYDGHCLRAYSYFSDQMPDITAELDEIKKDGEVYKVTMDDGSILYLNEHNPKLKELL